MKAIILAAGYATRLYPLTKNCPKPLLPVANKPILNYIIENIKNIKRIDKIFIISNNKFYRNYKEWLQVQQFKNLDIQILNDGSTSNENRLGALKDLLWCIKVKKLEDDFLVVAGDNLYNFELAEMIDFYDKKNANIIGVTNLKNKENIRNFGVVEFDENHKITNFIEKPVYSNVTTIAIGVYLFVQKIVSFLEEYIDSNNNSDAPGYFLEWLYKKDDIYAFVFEKPWFDIGDIDSYRRAKEFFEKEK